MGIITMIGLAADGKDGIVSIFSIINEELRRTMAICGCKNIDSISEDILVIS
jgi:isopentenyl diphosphate isomerase/L-lactate dehydrogenase-like FMN-dependent dehydrogenase